MCVYIVFLYVSQMHLLNKSVELNIICDWKDLLNEPRVNLSGNDFKDISSREEEEVA